MCLSGRWTSNRCIGTEETLELPPEVSEDKTGGQAALPVLAGDGQWGLRVGRRWPTCRGTQNVVFCPWGRKEHSPVPLGGSDLGRHWWARGQARDSCLDMSGQGTGGGAGTVGEACSKQ